MFLTFLGIGITAILAAGVVATYVRKDQALIRANTELDKLKKKPSTWDHEMADLRTELAELNEAKGIADIQLLNVQEDARDLAAALRRIYCLLGKQAKHRHGQLDPLLEGLVGLDFKVSVNQLCDAADDMDLIAGSLLALSYDDRTHLEKYGQLLDDQIERNVRAINAATEFLKNLGPVPTEARKQIEFYLREQQLGMMTVIVLFIFRRDKDELYLREQLSKIEDRTILRDTRHRAEQILNNLSAEHREVYLRLETSS